MGLFEKIRKVLSKAEPEIEIENSQTEILQEEYANRYKGNSEKISADVMDTLLLDEGDEEKPTETVIVSEYDAGDVDFDEFENMDNEDNSDKNVVVHESYDDLDEYLIGAEVIGDIPGEVLFDSEKS